jgi:nicotinamide-nucleotide amidase
MSEAETLSPAVPTRLETSASKLLGRACELGIMLATAESCTGGMLASLLTDVPGKAHAFDRGFVTYSEAAKIQMLGVPPELIEAFGAVSKEAALAMAEGALRQSQAQVAVSITGFADQGDEPGLIHFACAMARRETLHQVKHFGARGRGPNRIAAMEVAVEMMHQMLSR